MDKIRRIYRTFIPFLVIFLGLLLVIFILDGYAEQLTQQPQIIEITGISDREDTDPVSWRDPYADAGSGDEELMQDSIYMSARNDFRKANYTRAAEGFDMVAAMYPNSPVPSNYLGLISVRKGDYPGAAERFENALAIDPEFTDAAMNLASAYSKMKRYDEAEQHYIRTRQVSPNDPDIHYNLGILYRQQEDMERALEAFSTGIDLSSGDKRANAYIQRGMVKLHLADTLSAREDFNEAILLVPDSELARINYSRTLDNPAQQFEEIRKIYRLNQGSFFANYYLGDYYNEQGDAVLAEYHYKKALEQDPNHPELLEKLTNLLIDQERMEEASLVIDGFIAGDTMPQAYFLKAKMAANQADPEAAIRLYNLAVQRSGDNYPEALVNLAILRKDQQNYPEAIRNYKRAISSRPAYSLAWYNLALIYSDTDSLDQAISAYKNSIRYDSTSYKSWYNLGRLYEESGNREEEIEAYRSALRIRPDYTRALLELGNAYLGKSEFRAAADTYTELLSYYPKYTKAWFNLGLAYSRLDEDSRARDAYETLIALKPDHVSGRINLAILYARSGQVDLAISTLEEAVSMDMDNPDIRYNLALQYEKVDEFSKAVYQYRKVIDLDPRRHSAYDQLLELYETRGDEGKYQVIQFRRNREFGVDLDYYEVGKTLRDLEEYAAAIEAFQYVLDEGDTNRWALYWIGKSYMDMGEVLKGMPYFEQVLEIDPEHKFSWYRLGQIYDMLGETDLAMQHYDRLRALDSDFKIVRRSPEDLG